MNVLVIGSGGREHAICLKLKESNNLKSLYTVPKNSVFERFSKNIDLSPDDFEGIKDLCIAEKIDLVVVGPEDPLSAGISDYLISKGINVFGPCLKGAVLESSKQLAKEFMDRNYIPTAKFKVFYDFRCAKKYIAELQKFPVVIKADGLCAGKGVRICNNIDEANTAIEDFMEKRIFKGSGMKVIVEECLKGKECSVLALVDGKRYLLLPVARDHKRLNDGNTGPNTGGMGAVCPVDLSTNDIKKIEEEIITNFMNGIRKERIDYRGVIYFGIMMTEDGPKLLEFNVRFGDPETQAILPLVEDDLLDIFYKVASGKLDREKINLKNKYSVCVVLSAKGYPQNPLKGDEISGLDSIDKDITIFYSGIRIENGRYFTSGGRVLSLVGLGDSVDEARRKVYNNIKKIKFEGMHFRTDIGL
ncbi:MAG: phosphoribosylamine--glycine ligase [Elusimicrobiales bacterium]|jgi:phosphoribosylamine--glycine ligase|nr:phosphoribosylamine--glycine ligase [Elusimicrobiales bacterium]NLH39187.1 phosphoribosylamine--glycine ligase [Elusimicrobiota bacterium]